MLTAEKNDSDMLMLKIYVYIGMLGVYTNLTYVVLCILNKNCLVLFTA